MAELATLDFSPQRLGRRGGRCIRDYPSSLDRDQLMRPRVLGVWNCGADFDISAPNVSSRSLAGGTCAVKRRKMCRDSEKGRHDSFRCGVFELHSAL
jgi:hypothetical protein